MLGVYNEKAYLLCLVTKISMMVMIYTIFATVC